MKDGYPSNQAELDAMLASLVSPRVVTDDIPVIVREGVSQEVSQEVSNTKKSSRPAYPWAKWCDGEYHNIRRGVDFDVPRTTMQLTLYNTAARKGLYVFTEKWAGQGDEGIGFQMFRTKHERDMMKYGTWEEADGE